jgi:hypothetical protein
MTPEPDPHIAVIGPLALAVLTGRCPLGLLADCIAETGWDMPPEVVDDYVGRVLRDRPITLAKVTTAQLEAIIAHWRERQATAALRAAPPNGAGTCYHETPRPG